MTSSLVGSEMCIRDRIQYTSGKRGHCGISMVKAVNCWSTSRDEGNSSTSVSYTHLTLPTICSV
eukprot:12832097-Prorocentrum_lima.AAC.1